MNKIQTTKRGKTKWKKTTLPGKRAVARAKLMAERGADVIVFASCISRGNPIGIPCPHFTVMKESIIKKLGSTINIIEWTH